jgi:hypothetical protein
MLEITALVMPTVSVKVCFATLLPLALQTVPKAIKFTPTNAAEFV